MTWLPETSEGETALEQVFGLRPQLFERFKDFYFGVWEPGRIDPVLLELCRLRIARLHGCAGEASVRYAPARAAGLRDEKVAALDGWRDDPSFAPVERACLGFAENFALAVQCIGDEDVAALAQHLSAAEIVVLCEAVALFDGFTRLRVLLDVESEGNVVDPARSRRLS